MRGLIFLYNLSNERVILMANYVSYNSNPDKNRVGDCTVRAISSLLGKEWDEVYIGLAVMGFIMRDMPSSDAVWGAYLRRNGCERNVIPNDLPSDYTVREFCEDFPSGEYILAIPGHVVYAADGKYYDTWDSGSEIPLYYWRRKDS